MFAILFLGVIACALSLVLTPVVRQAFITLGILDHPDGDRKLHVKAVPRAGGVPIALSYAGAIGLAIVILPQGSRLASHHASIFVWLLAAALMILCTGLVDDIVGLKPKSKLAMQLLAASLACYGGVQISTIAGQPLSPWLGFPLTVFWIVACTNALNLIDGIDGLATGVGVFATLTALAAACMQDNIGLALATAPLAGALLGFLRYNFNPASVFLGDSGSLTVGFLLGCFAVIWCQKSATLLGMAAPLISLLVPLMDVSVSVARRFISNRPIFTADGRHIHHRLLALGLKPRAAALVLYTACGAAAVLSLLDSLMSRQIGGFIVILVCVLAGVGLRFLAYDEFAAARQIAVNYGFRRAVNEQLSLQQFEVRMAQALDLEQCWPLIRDLCYSFKFHSVGLACPARTFGDADPSSSPMPSETSLWRLEIAIHPEISLVLHRRSFGRDKLPGMEFIRTIQRAVQGKELPAVRDDSAELSPEIVAAF